MRTRLLKDLSVLRDDTIFALATPDQPAALAVVRTSGPRAFAVAAELAATTFDDRAATKCSLAGLAGLTVAATVLLTFRGPRSHTGEDVVEYLLPGNPLLTSLLLTDLKNRGLRPAEPGEFSARAFFHGKTTLDAAEGVAASIAATNDRQLAAASRLRGGELARRLEGPMNDVADLAALCELAIDFSEEDVTVLAADEARRRIDAVSADLRELLDAAPRLDRLGRPPRVALVGRANAGKSTLLNALAGRPRAVAAPTPGTTRDALAADVDLSAGRATLVDLAGLEETPLHDIDAAAAEVARREAAAADVLVLLRAAGDDRPDPILPRTPDLTVLTKCDAETAKAGPPLRVSAHAGVGLETLKTRLNDLAFAASSGDGLALNARHAAAVADALAALDDARSSVGAGDELVAHALRSALDSLGSVVGLVSPDAILGRVFSQFCIGK